MGDVCLNDLLTSWDNLKLAWHNASIGKRGRAATAAFEMHLADNLLSLQTELENQTYQPGAYHSFYIHEPKRRLISAAPFRDRVVHHALCSITVPYLERQFSPYSFANRPGKGTHRALDRCQQLARRYSYFLQCDLVQYFPSIDHAILLETLRRLVPAEDIFWLVERILHSGEGVLSEQYNRVYFPGDDLFSASRPRGLPIGNLTSQWWANAYLNPFDQFVQRELGCTGYCRYVDDFLLFAENKRQLWAWRQALVARLARLRLTIHPASAIPRPVSDGIPFLGFVVYPQKRRLKRRKGIAYQRKLKRLVQLGDSATICASVRGWINHARYANTTGLRQALLAKYNLLVEV